jgi:hypothetical protein
MALAFFDLGEVEDRGQELLELVGRVAQHRRSPSR